MKAIGPMQHVKTERDMQHRYRCTSEVRGGRRKGARQKGEAQGEGRS